MLDIIQLTYATHRVVEYNEYIYQQNESGGLPESHRKIEACQNSTLQTSSVYEIKLA